MPTSFRSTSFKFIFMTKLQSFISIVDELNLLYWYLQNDQSKESMFSFRYKKNKERQSSENESFHLIFQSLRTLVNKTWNLQILHRNFDDCFTVMILLRGLQKNPFHKNFKMLQLWFNAIRVSLKLIKLVYWDPNSFSYINIFSLPNAKFINWKNCSSLG